MNLLRQAGFNEVGRMRREPHEGERQFHQVHLLVRKGCGDAVQIS
jgi:hypothetical protein